MIFMNSVCRRLMCLLIILLIVTAQARAQDGAEQQEQTAALDGYQLPLRAGIAAGKSLRLSLNETIALMLENNIDIQMEKNVIKRNRQALLAAEGVYDYVIGAQADYHKSTQPTISALQGDPRSFLFERTN